MNADRSSVQSVEKAFQLLYELATGPADRSPGQLGKVLGFSKPTVYRLLHALEKSGVVYRQASGSYAFGHRLRELASHDLRYIELRACAAGPMTRLRDATGETVALYVATTPFEFVCIESLQGSHHIRRYEQIGQSTPAVRGATSMVLLADAMEVQGRDVVASYLKGVPTEVRPADIGRYCDRLTHVHERGVAFTKGERIPGAASIAAPIPGAGTGRQVAAINVSGPIDRFDDPATVEEWKDAVRHRADAIARALRERRLNSQPDRTTSAPVRSGTSRSSRKAGS